MVKPSTVINVVSISRDELNEGAALMDQLFKEIEEATNIRDYHTVTFSRDSPAVKVIELSGIAESVDSDTYAESFMFDSSSFETFKAWRDEINSLSTRKGLIKLSI